MLKKLRHDLTKHLWEGFIFNSPDVQKVNLALNNKNIYERPLDHFAIIDLPGPHSGIPTLQKIFEMLGYEMRGRDYLAEKQNDFLWLAAEDNHLRSAKEALPQVVVADFRMDALPPKIQTIVKKCAQHIKPFPLEKIEKLLQTEDADNIMACTKSILDYLTQRDWPLPTLNDYLTVKEFNPLLAWVLVFGRRPNHFTLSIHLLSQFNSLLEFNQFIEYEIGLALNNEGGKIKGGPHSGLAQGSTAGVATPIHLADGDIAMPIGFVEFVWRYPLSKSRVEATLWTDYYTGFIAQHADKIIESLA